MPSTNSSASLYLKRYLFRDARFHFWVDFLGSTKISESQSWLPFLGVRQMSSHPPRRGYGAAAAARGRRWTRECEVPRSRRGADTLKGNRGSWDRFGLHPGWNIPRIFRVEHFQCVLSSARTFQVGGKRPFWSFAGMFCYDYESHFGFRCMYANGLTDQLSPRSTLISSYRVKLPFSFT